MKPASPPVPSRRQVLKGGLTAAVLAAMPAYLRAAEASVRRPNIVLLLSDDQRADSLSCAGNAILRTPNLDALAAGGVRFTRSFATTAICMSSRASILTGLYTRQHGITDFGTPLDRKLFEASYPMLLRRAGYRTGFVGKWGLGGALPTTDYDFFEGYSGQGSYFEPGDPTHLTPRQAAQAVQFLGTCRADQPFCLAVSFKAPHVQDEGRQLPGIYAKYPYDRALDALYANQQIPPPATVDAAPMPDFLQQSMNRTREGQDFLPKDYQETMRDLYRLLTGVDQAVGTITAELRRLGFADNTVVIFSSDHGSFYGEHGFGGKWLMLEESIRTPMMIADPRRAADRRGTVRNEMVLNLDLPATILDLAGVPAPVGMQGRSLVPLLRGSPPSLSPAGHPSSRPIWREEWFYENHFRNDAAEPIAASEGIRTSDWKYIRYIDQNPVYEQLFDLKSDPREERNLAGEPAHQAKLEALRQRWSAWQASLDNTKAGERWSEPV